MNKRRGKKHAAFSSHLTLLHTIACNRRHELATCIPHLLCQGGVAAAHLSSAHRGDRQLRLPLVPPLCCLRVLAGLHHTHLYAHGSSTPRRRARGEARETSTHSLPPRLPQAEADADAHSPLLLLDASLPARHRLELPVRRCPAACNLRQGPLSRAATARVSTLRTLPRWRSTLEQRLSLVIEGHLFGLVLCHGLLVHQLLVSV